MSYCIYFAFKCGAQKGVKPKITFFTLQQQQLGVISKYVDSKADYRLGLVHVAPQNSS